MKHTLPIERYIYLFRSLARVSRRPHHTFLGIWLGHDVFASGEGVDAVILPDKPTRAGTRNVPPTLPNVQVMHTHTRARVKAA